MQNNLAVISPNEWEALKSQAKALVDSGFLPTTVNTPQKAVAIMMLGRELGIPPWAALSTVNVIQGKPTVSPQLMLALINRSGQLEDMQVQDEGGTVHVMMKRRGRSEHWESFGQADAIAMNLWSKPNWKSQPATMMKWRAVAACARVVFADVILGLYTPEEMGADVRVDNDGNMEVIDVAPEPLKQLQDGVEAPSAPPRPEQPLQPPPQAPVPLPGGQNAPLASTVPTLLTSGTEGASGDKLAQTFPAASKWTPQQLYDATHDYFNAPEHFAHHWGKHEAEYTGKTLEEAAALTRQLHWNYDKAQCDKLKAFGVNTLALTPNEILAALADANGHSVKRWKDWDGGSFTVAEGALLAWKSNYNAQAIRDNAENMGIGSDVAHTALTIGEMYRSEHAEQAATS